MAIAIPVIAASSDGLRLGRTGVPAVAVVVPNPITAAGGRHGMGVDGWNHRLARKDLEISRAKPGKLGRETQRLLRTNGAPSRKLGDGSQLFP